MRCGHLLLLLAGMLACVPLAGGTPDRAPVPRSAEELRIELPREEGRLHIEDDPARPLVASVYSLPSTLIDPGQASAMLHAVRAADRGRELLALVDAPMRDRLAPLVRALDVRLLATRGGPYSPWPRDPFGFGRASNGAVRVIVRPNVQAGREADAALGPELIQDLPPDLDREWLGARWVRADVPFHNGQVLLTGDAAWATLHTFEPRALQLLGLARVPVDTFGTEAGVGAYLGAVERAAAELGELYGRPLRFVHPLPGAGSPAAGEEGALLRRIGGGAGYDLDSLVTLLPRAPSAVRSSRPTSSLPSALVADLALGQRLLDTASPSEWASFASTYELVEGADLRAAMGAFLRRDGPRDLGSFLDLVATHLETQGYAVARLPLVLVPSALLRIPRGLPHDHFLVGWNNVVVETRRGGVRAEGFASGLASGDRLAREAFEARGVRLDLLPPLVESVVRNGGYRCASNHLRGR